MLPKKSCCYCLFEEVCSKDYTYTSENRCGYFSPLYTIDDSDSELEAFIENNRRLYYNDWIEYIDQDNE